MRRPTPPRVRGPQGGRSPKYDGKFAFSATAAEACLAGGSIAYDGPLSITEGTVVRLVVERLSSGG